MIRSRVLSAIVAIAVAGGVAAARPGSAASPHQGQPGPVPAHVFAPYFEAYTTDSPARLSAQSGARYLTLAFLQTPSRGSCVIEWNGNPATPVAWSIYGADIARIRASGGDVIPSFGGYSADHDGTEIADSCTDVSAIAAAYEKVIQVYGVTRLDLDTEDNSLTNNPGIDRRNRAIRMVEEWAARQQRTVQFVYTVPTNVHGLDLTGVHVLQNAVANHARIDVFNIMTFDYYDNQPHEMARDTFTAAGHLHETLHLLYPEKSSAQLWGAIGITEMVGVDDFGPAETFTTRDARIVESWAEYQGIAELSFWSLERDNRKSSGVPQSTWQFSHTFEPFTQRPAG